MSRPRPAAWSAASLLAAGLLAAGLLTAGPAGATGTPARAPHLFTTTSPTPATPSPSPSSQRPAGPTDLRVVAVTSTSVTLAWSPATPGSHPIAGYDISRHRAFDDVVYGHSIGDVTTTTVTGLSPTGNYALSITARDTAGNRSITGSRVDVVTPASDTAADQTPPSRPTDLVVVDSGPGGAVLSWSPSTDDVGVTAYEVYLFDGLFYSVRIATVTGTTATVPGTTGRQSLYVRARDAAGNLSAESNTVRAPDAPVTPPTVPPSTPPAPGCTISYRLSGWTGGFVADIQIGNPTATPIENWTLGFSFGGDQTVQTAWGTGSLSQSGRAVTATPAGWTRVIPPGGSVTIGVLGRWTTSNAPPTGFTLNGSSCTVSQPAN